MSQQPFSTSKKDTTFNSSFPVSANHLCKLISTEWKEVSTKNGLSNALVLTFKDNDNVLHTETYYDITLETVYKFDDETPEKAFARKAKEYSWIIRQILICYDLEEVADGLVANSFEELARVFIQHIKPVGTQNIPIYLKLIPNSSGYSMVPQRGISTFIQKASVGPTLEYSKYETKLLDKTYDKSSSTKEANKRVEVKFNEDEIDDLPTTQPTESFQNKTDINFEDD